MKNKLRYVIIILLSLVNVLVILSVSSNKVTDEKYLSNKINTNINVIDLVNSKKLDKNKTIKKTREYFKKISSIGTLLNKEDLVKDKILNSDILKQVISKMSYNIVLSIKNNNSYSLYNINDYYKLLDDNIDNILEDINMPLIKNFKSTILSYLKDLGNDVVKDIPNTNKVTDKIPKYKYYVMHFILSDKIQFSLIIIDIILILSLLILYKNMFIISMIISLSINFILILISQLYLLFISSKYINEWYFVKLIIKDYINIIMIYSILIVIILLLLIIFKIFNKKKTSQIN